MFFRCSLNAMALGRYVSVIELGRNSLNDKARHKLRSATLSIQHKLSQAVLK